MLLSHRLNLLVGRTTLSGPFYVAPAFRLLRSLHCPAGPLEAPRRREHLHRDPLAQLEVLAWQETYLRTEAPEASSRSVVEDLDHPWLLLKEGRELREYLFSRHVLKDQRHQGGERRQGTVCGHGSESG
jgi:hypothetical protein